MLHLRIIEINRILTFLIILIILCDMKEIQQYYGANFGAKEKGLAFGVFVSP